MFNDCWWPRFQLLDHFLGFLCKNIEFKMRTTIYEWKKKKLSKRTSCHQINLLCTSGQLYQWQSFSFRPRPLAGTIIRGVYIPTDRTSADGKAEPIKFAPSTSDALSLCVLRKRQMCAVKINTARKETSHRVNQYPAKDNGIPVQAAVSCPLPLAPVSESSQGRSMGNSPHSSILGMIISASDSEAPHAAKQCPFLLKCRQTMTSPLTAGRDLVNLSCFTSVLPFDSV